MSRLLKRLEDTQETESAAPLAQVLPFPVKAGALKRSSSSLRVVGIAAVLVSCAAIAWVIKRHRESTRPGSSTDVMQGMLAQNRASIEAFEAGKWTSAIEGFEALIARNPDSATLRINLAIALRHADQPKNSRKSFEAALKLDPQNPAALDGLARLELDADTEEGDLEATRLLQRSLASPRSTPSTLLELGKMAEHSGDWKSAVDYYDRYLKSPMAEPVLSRLLTKRIDKIAMKAEPRQ